MTAIADCLCSADIYFSTLSLTSPSFDLLENPGSLIASGKLAMDAAAQEFDSELGSGFRYLRSTASGRGLLLALERICEVTVAVDQYQRGAEGAPDMVDIVPSRNAAQHNLLSLQSSIVSADTEDVLIVHACRVAALIYNDIVIFPQPAAQGVKIRQAINLREALEHHFEQYSLERHAKVLVWATTLGAIGTSFTPGQHWFIQRLSWQTSELGVDNWTSLQQICAKFLWWRPVCEEPVLRIWNDMLTHTACQIYGPDIG
jgi:hypothetical protein